MTDIKTTKNTSPSSGDIYVSSAYKTSRRAYSLQCMFEYFITLLSADAFLAKLLKYIGLSDAVTGVISSLITFTFLFQLLSIPLAAKLKRIKKPVIILDTVSQLFFASVFAVPFLPISSNGKAVAVVLFILLGYLTLYLNTTICYKWGNSFVSPEKRGDFSAVKEMISLLSGVGFTIFTGKMFDSFEFSDNLTGGFKFVMFTMIIVCLFNFLCLALMKEKPLDEGNASRGIKEILSCTFGNKSFRNTIILTALTEIARYMTIGFMGTYKTVDLGLSMEKIQLINVLSNLGRFAVSKPIGRYSDKKGFSKGYFAGNIINFLAFFVGIFMSKSFGFLIIPFTVLLQMSYAGTNQNTFNMAYCYVDEKHILSAIAVNNSVRGIAGFVASFMGGLILDAVQNSNKFAAMNITGQQVLCLISTLIALVSLIFNKTVVMKQTEEKK